MNIKQKVEGISLVISLGASLLVLAMGIGILTSVEKSHQRSIDIENSIQFFYGSESSIEAALFHKKARGKGAHFPDPLDSAEAQTLGFYNGAMQTRWKLFGRAGTGTNPIIGMLREGEAVELPLFWDKAATPDVEGTPGVPLDPDAFDDTGDTFTLTFYRGSDGIGDLSIKEAFIEEFGEVSGDFAFDASGAEGDRILIDWDMSRINVGVASETFAVMENDGRNYCTAEPVKTHNFCMTAYNNNALSLSSENVAVPGKVNHRLRDAGTLAEAPWTLEEFNEFDNAQYQNFQLSFNSGLVQYEDPRDGSKLRGIPYSIATSNKDVPTPYYQIFAEVDNINRFNQRLEIELKEEVANKNFRYVIFD